MAEVCSNTSSSRVSLHNLLDEDSEKSLNDEVSLPFFVKAASHSGKEFKPDTLTCFQRSID